MTTAYRNLTAPKSPKGDLCRFTINRNLFKNRGLRQAPFRGLPAGRQGLGAKGNKKKIDCYMEIVKNNN
jgi:hypothetical protein